MMFGFNQQIQLNYMQNTRFGIMLVSVLLGLFVIVGCGNDDSISYNCRLANTSELTCILYEQTLCSDPWGNNSDNDILVEDLKNYFDSLEVELLELEFEDNGPQVVCLACHCKSGSIFHAQVKRSKLDIVVANGFIEKQ